MNTPGISAIDTSDAGIAALFAAFDAQELPKTHWTHEAHVLVGLWYVCHEPEPLTRMREGIKRLNAAHGVASTPTGGYHETLTRFYIWAVQRYVAEERHRVGSEASIGQLAAGVLSQVTRGLPLLYYSADQLYSPLARFGWVEPDLRPL